MQYSNELLTCLTEFTNFLSYAVDCPIIHRRMHNLSTYYFKNKMSIILLHYQLYYYIIPKMHKQSIEIAHSAIDKTSILLCMINCL